MYAHVLVLCVYLLLSIIMIFKLQTNEILRNDKNNGTNIFIIHLLSCTRLDGCSHMTNTAYIYTHIEHTLPIYLKQ